MNKIDFNEIPERFHILFNSDWNEGPNSSLELAKRINCHELYLEYNKWVIKRAIIESSMKIDDDKPKGFVKD